MGRWYSTSVAVPRERSTEAVLALHGIGYEARITDQPSREVHPGFVVIETNRHLPTDDGGRQNSEQLKAVLSSEGITHHIYGSGISLGGGSSVHRWSDVFTVQGVPLGLKVLVATPADVEEQLRSVADVTGMDRASLVVDPPEYSLARLRPEPRHEVPTRMDDEYRQAREGLAMSIDRFEDARRKGDAVSVASAVTEVLAWAVSLDDWHARRLSRGEGPGPYRRLRGELDQQAWMPAARWARNRALHDLSPLIEVTEGAQWPTPWPVILAEHRWKPRAAVPPAGPGYRRDPDGEAAYDRHAGEPVRHLVYALRHLVRDEFWRMHHEPPRSSD